MSRPERVVYRTQGHRRPKHWRDRPDALLPAQNLPGGAESLHPGPQLILRYADKDPVARAVIAAWRPSRAWQNLVRVEVAA